MIIIIIIIRRLNAVEVQCPISSSLGEFPSYWDWSGVLGFRPYWCPSSFPSLSILGVFHSLLSAIGFQSCFFFTADISPPIRSTLHLLTFEVSIQAWDWLWYPMLWSQRRTAVRMEQKTRSKFLPWPG